MSSPLGGKVIISYHVLTERFVLIPLIVTKTNTHGLLTEHLGRTKIILPPEKKVKHMKKNSNKQAHFACSKTQ